MFESYQNKYSICDFPCHIDDRGKIQMILENCSVGSISRIESLSNTIRARHIHVKDYHYCEVISGEIEYYHQLVSNIEDLGGSSFIQSFQPEKYIVKVGEMIFTPPMFFHEMVFNTYTIFNCYSYLVRNQENYENETIKYPHLSLKKIYIKA